MVTVQDAQFTAWEKLAHTRARIAGIARDLAEAMRLEADTTEIMIELRSYLAAENSCKLEWSLALALQVNDETETAQGAEYEVSCS